MLMRIRSYRFVFYCITLGIAVGSGIILASSYGEPPSAGAPDSASVVVSENGSVPVTHVVDGDTIDVESGGVKERVRLLGINTPESVDPRRPVQCFGKEA